MSRARRASEVAAIAVDVLTEERDLADAVSGEITRFVDKFAEGTRDLGPRTAGTMQNAQVLSQPIWIVSQPAWSTSRRAGKADGKAS